MQDITVVGNTCFDDGSGDQDRGLQSYLGSGVTTGNDWKNVIIAHNNFANNVVEGINVLLSSDVIRIGNIETDDSKQIVIRGSQVVLEPGSTTVPALATTHDSNGTGFSWSTGGVLHVIASGAEYLRSLASATIQTAVTSIRNASGALHLDSPGSVAINIDTDANTTSASLVVRADASANNLLAVFENGSMVHGNDGLATNATDGFFYIRSGAGAPSGTPTSFSNRVPMYYDRTNDELYVYNGGWLTCGAAAPCVRHVVAPLTAGFWHRSPDPSLRCAAHIQSRRSFRAGFT